MSELETLLHALYPALAAGDRETLEQLLAPDFDAHFADGLPHGIGGHKHGADAAIAEGWWPIGRVFSVRVEIEEWIETVDGRMLVVGTYRGRARATARTFTAAFVHLWTTRDGRLSELLQVTDTARWLEAL